MGYFPNIEHPLWKGDCKWCLSSLLGKRIIGISSLSPRHDDLVNLSIWKLSLNTVNGLIHRRSECLMVKEPLLMVSPECYYSASLVLERKRHAQVFGTTALIKSLLTATASHFHWHYLAVSIFRDIGRSRPSHVSTTKRYHRRL